MTEEFKTGDIVRLKSGSPAMTVLYVKDHIAKLVWYNKEKFDFSNLSINVICLELSKSDDSKYFAV